MERVFGKTWLMLGHISEIPNPRDFILRHMGEDQVIVARDAAGAVHVSLNVCPHRGMRVCTAEAGNAPTHRCIYHGWAFRPDGSFIGSPIEKENMHGTMMDKSELGLKKARVHLYAGMIFATWNIDGPSFDEFLGDMKFYYDMLFDRTEKGLELLCPPQRFVVDANWKTAGEQSAADGFHTLTLHRSLMETGVIGGAGLGGDAAEAIYAIAPAMYAVDVGDEHGHALRCIPAEVTYTFMRGRTDISGMSTDERLEDLPPPGMQRELLPELRAKMTPDQVRLMATQPPLVGGMFPNVLIAFIYAPRDDGGYPGALTLHTYNPRGVDQLEFVNYIFAEADATPEMKRDMLANSIQQTGTSGTIEQDDSDTWPQMQANARSFMGRQSTMKYQAIGGEKKPDNWPGGGRVYEGFSKDDTQWNWWLAYRDLMTA
ncbi:Rieske 2Fe-2S domain-containing protein [Novosphingobium sp. BL-52-GroH]|uniref:Rieske 2Fe-2S domain-containing protein n=1 Tax=Novosphingobium sp. BL-52-GroH TaxID=3349877 RepID=UPI00384BE824